MDFIIALVYMTTHKIIVLNSILYERFFTMQIFLIMIFTITPMSFTEIIVPAYTILNQFYLSWLTYPMLFTIQESTCHFTRPLPKPVEPNELPKSTCITISIHFTIIYEYSNATFTCSYQHISKLSTYLIWVPQRLFWFGAKAKSIHVHTKSIFRNHSRAPISYSPPYIVQDQPTYLFFTSLKGKGKGIDSQGISFFLCQFSVVKGDQ